MWGDPPRISLSCWAEGAPLSERRQRASREGRRKGHPLLVLQAWLGSTGGPSCLLVGALGRALGVRCFDGAGPWGCLGR